MLAWVPTARAEAGAAPLSASEQVARMGTGVNILGYDPYWKKGGEGNYREEHFKAIRDAGFGSVRVVLFTFPYLDARGELDPEWLQKLDRVVAMGSRYGLQTILDVHDFDACAKDLAGCAGRVLPEHMRAHLDGRQHAAPVRQAEAELEQRVVRECTVGDQQHAAHRDIAHVAHDVLGHRVGHFHHAGNGAPGLAA